MNSFFEVPSIDDGTLAQQCHNVPLLSSRKIFNHFPGFGAKKLALRSTTALIWSVKPHKFFLQSLLLSVGFTIPILLIPSIIRWGIDQALIPQRFTQVWLIGGVILLLGLISAISFSAFQLVIKYYFVTVSYLISTAISEQAMRLGKGLHTLLSTGEIISVSSSDIQRFSRLSGISTRLFAAITMTIFGLVMLAHVNMNYALIAVISTLIISISVIPLLFLVYRREHAFREAESEQTGRSGDIISGLRILSGIGGKEVFARSYARSAQRTRQAKFSASSPWIAIDTIIICGNALMVAAITFLAFVHAMNNRATIGSYEQAVGQASMYASSIWSYVEIFFISITGRVSAERILRFLRLTPAITDSSETQQPSTELLAPQQPAELVDSRSQFVLSPGTLTVLMCQDLGIATGIARRLARVTPDVDGVYWSTTPLADIPLEQIRAKIVFSDNDDHLFPGTLKENITLGKSFSDAQITEAMHASACDELIEILDDGLESKIIEKARNLSGGQRQRIRLARALLFNPPTLLLIDPTSAVDAYVEMVISRRIARYRKINPNFTTLIVSNSPHITQYADTIIVVDHQGSVVFHGTPTELKNATEFSAITTRMALDVPSTPSTPSTPCTPSIQSSAQQHHDTVADVLLQPSELLLNSHSDRNGDINSHSPHNRDMSDMSTVNKNEFHDEH